MQPLPVPDRTLPFRARFHFQPKGADIVFDFDDGARTVQLPELRARLMAVLLDPPRGYSRDDYLPDAVVMPLIWPGQRAKHHRDLNVLIYRVRKDLRRAGIDPTALIDRPLQGRGVRICLQPGARVDIC